MKRGLQFVCSCFWFVRGDKPCSRLLNGPAPERPGRFPGASGRCGDKWKLQPRAESYLQPLITTLSSSLMCPLRRLRNINDDYFQL